MENNINNKEKIASNWMLKKVEKLIAAVFIVASSINDNIFLKDKIMELSTELLSFINRVDLNSEFSPLIKRQMLPARGMIEEIVSMLNVSRMSGLVSEMNYQILAKELTLFANMIDDAESGFLSDMLKQEMPDQPRLFAGAHSKISNHNFRNLHLKGSNDVAKKHQGQTNVFYKKESSYQGPGGVDLKETRKVKILEFIKDNQEASIKDICKIKDKSISACSEKTIQRELTNLIKKGYIKRMGDKRWARYSLKG